jgi:diguanylate cyclase (GGDEF)-like protein
LRVWGFGEPLLTGGENTALLKPEKGRREKPQPIQQPTEAMHTGTRAEASELVREALNAHSGDTPVPADAVVDVLSEPSAELFRERLPALTALLRMALLGGIEMALPTTLHLTMDLSEQVVASDRQVAVVAGESGREDLPRLQVSRHCEGIEIPAAEENILNRWTMHAAKPVLGQLGVRPELDEFLKSMKATAAISVPLFLEHAVVGSLQVFRERPEAFSPADAQLLWILSLLAETQMARTSAMQNLLRVAFTDYLTGLKTRGYFEQELEQEINRTVRRRTTCGLLLIDLDDFKKVNDRYGHHTGDEVLRQFADVLLRDMRQIDTVARYGGDEFSVILPDTDTGGALFVATRIRDAVRNARFELSEVPTPLQLNVSIGVAMCPMDANDPRQLLRAADLALYQAKREGKNRLLFSHEAKRLG